MRSPEMFDETIIIQGSFKKSFEQTYPSTKGTLKEMLCSYGIQANDQLLSQFCSAVCQTTLRCCIHDSSSQAERVARAGNIRPQQVVLQAKKMLEQLTPYLAGANQIDKTPADILQSFLTHGLQQRHIEKDEQGRIISNHLINLDTE